MAVVLLRSSVGELEISGTLFEQADSFAYGKSNTVEEVYTLGSPDAHTASTTQSGQGTFAAYYDPANAQQAAIIAAMTAGTDVSIGLYPEGNTTGKQSWTGTLSIESWNMQLEGNSLQRFDVGFKGTMTPGTVA